MSELKVINLDDIREAIENDESVFYEYYAKSEADKVIAKLNNRIKFLQVTHSAGCNHCNECAEGMGKVFDETLDELKKQKKFILEHATDVIRRQKYKRCVVMAKWCKYWAIYWKCCEPPDCSLFIAKAKYYRKWQRRWLKIAKQFKEDK